MSVRAFLALLLFALLSWSHWQAYNEGYDRSAAKCAQRERDAEEAARSKADSASETHAQNTEAIRTEIQTVVREVPRVVEKPVYRNVCLDADGLRLVRQAIGPGGVAREPAPAVSAPGAPR